jgi:hypothetical protein
MKGIVKQEYIWAIFVRLIRAFILNIFIKIGL